MILLLGLLGAGLLVDTGAESGFDAPKRFAAVIATAAAAAIVVAFGDLSRAREAWRSAPRGVQLSVALFGAGLAGIAITALTAPHAEMAMATARGSLVLALAAPLTALLFDAGSMRRALTWFEALASLNALLSLLQRAGAWKPFAIERISGRTDAIGLFGNEGLLALVAALGATAAAALWLDSKGKREAKHAVAFVLCVAGVVANASVTPALALGAGLTVLVFYRMSRRRFMLGVTALLAASLLAVALVPQLRLRTVEARELYSAGEYDALTSYRFGAWASAMEMIAARPWMGLGPGTFAAEFVEHRIDAERRWGRRLVNPAFAGGSYVDAHCDYLQIAAESGVVVAIVLAISVALTGLRLVRVARERTSGSRHEAQALLALGAVVAVSSLAWFPMQRPATALFALIVLGRSWSVASSAGEGAE